MTVYCKKCDKVFMNEIYYSEHVCITNLVSLSHEICKREYGEECRCFQCRITDLVNWNKATPLERRKMMKLINGGLSEENKVG